MARKTIQLYLLLTLVKNLGVSSIAATYVVFLISRGLNLFEVNLVNFVFFTALFLCEIPTGVVADVFGRKVSFVISCFLFSAGMFMYAASHSFLWFAFAEAISAVGSTFASGAFQAWLVDKLKHHNHAEPLGSIFVKEQWITQGVSIVGAIAGAFLADKNLAFPWIFGGVVMCVAGVLAFTFMKEEYFVRQHVSLQSGLKSMRATILASVRYSMQSRAMRFILVMGILQYFAIQAPNMQWQPFFSRFLPDKTSFGFLFGGISICMIIGSAFSLRFLRFMQDERRALVVSQIGIGAGIMATVLFNWFPLAVGVFLLHEVVRGLFRPLKDVYLNNSIPSQERATLISFESMSHHIGGMAGLLFSGFFAEYASIPTAWILSGGILIVTTLWLIRNRRV
ncbi:MAG: hypothetical protein A3C82_02490 [Candidatus Wildermuthbacteria bacterium RIFCSPHIGHO2_02_FULL_47_12]|uniref:Major facilitator superfamily (MFS) profile domain-containing protein n=1 Tax=Candidatus Wildermuthbacteria bacterium RIFCSPHIGHO2_02_FULL_47_12 TaxID=1802451 RepID=A0A1G2R2N3_9BACT|nr:MAG: hypothetical protein A3C82_02490 [Candidatus Wildermuthbacteria bacterium RIFCSPHIGHO2_02_FULL_47_12]